MLLLSSATHKVQVVTSAAGQVDIVAAYMDLVTGAVSGAGPLYRVTTATTTDVVPTLASGLRNMKELRISNSHASVTNTITLQVTDGTVTAEVEKVTLLAGERLGYTEGSGIRVFDAQGREKLQTAQVESAQNAITADQTINGVDAYVTGSDYPITGRLKVGSIIRWTITFTKTDTVGTTAPIWNIRVGTAGAIGDTARCTMTGRAQTTNTDTARVEISAHVRIFSSVGTLQAVMGGDHGLATTGISTGGFANQVLSATHDLTLANLKAGVSINPGTSSVWVVKTCSVEGINLLA